MRRVRTTGLLTVVSLALMASVVAAGASASGFVTNNGGKAQYPALTSSSTSVTPYFVFNSLTYIQCDASEIGPSVLEGPAKQVGTDMAGNSCTNSYWAEPVSMKYNNCKLSFQPGAETGSGEFGGTYAIGGSGCTGITLKKTGTGTNYCYITIPPQSGLPATFVNNGSGNTASVTMTQAVSSPLRYSVEGKAVNCPKEGEHTNGYWSYSRSTKATNELGEQIGLSVNASAPTGFFVEGGNFQAEAYPQAIAGDQTTPVKITPGAVGNIECGTVRFASLLSALTSALSPAVEVANCNAAIGGSNFKTNVKMNSCRYAFQAAGTLGIACSKEGDVIAIEIYNAAGTAVKCTVKIGAQEGLSSVSYSTVGSGVDRGVKATLGVSGLTYSTDAGLLNCGVGKGTKTDGSISGSATLYGGAA